MSNKQENNVTNFKNLIQLFKRPANVPQLRDRLIYKELVESFSIDESTDSKDYSGSYSFLTSTPQRSTLPKPKNALATNTTIQNTPTGCFQYQSASKRKPNFDSNNFTTIKKVKTSFENTPQKFTTSTPHHTHSSSGVKTPLPQKTSTHQVASNQSGTKQPVFQTETNFTTIKQMASVTCASPTFNLNPNNRIGQLFNQNFQTFESPYNSPCTPNVIRNIEKECTMYYRCRTVNQSAFPSYYPNSTVMFSEDKKNVSVQELPRRSVCQFDSNPATTFTNRIPDFVTTNKSITEEHANSLIPCPEDVIENEICEADEEHVSLNKLPDDDVKSSRSLVNISNAQNETTNLNTEIDNVAVTGCVENNEANSISDDVCYVKDPTIDAEDDLESCVDADNAEELASDIENEADQSIEKDVEHEEDSAEDDLESCVDADDAEELSRDVENDADQSIDKDVEHEEDPVEDEISCADDEEQPEDPADENEGEVDKFIEDVDKEEIVDRDHAEDELASFIDQAEDRASDPDDEEQVIFAESASCIDKPDGVVESSVCDSEKAPSAILNVDDIVKTPACEKANFDVDSELSPCCTEEPVVNTNETENEPSQVLKVNINEISAIERVESKNNVTCIDNSNVEHSASDVRNVSFSDEDEPVTDDNKSASLPYDDNPVEDPISEAESDIDDEDNNKHDENFGIEAENNSSYCIQEDDSSQIPVSEVEQDHSLHQVNEQIGMINKKIKNRLFRILDCETPQKIIKPNEFGNNIRRSQRNRALPLQYWRGERPIYKTQNVDGIVTNTLVGVKSIKEFIARKRTEKLKKKQTQVKAPPQTVTEITKTSTKMVNILDLSINVSRAKKLLQKALTDEDDLKHVFPYSNCTWKDSNKSKGVYTAITKKNEKSAFGLLRFDPKSTKANSKSTYEAVFTVIYGALILKVDSKTSLITPGTSFEIKKDTLYSIKNGRSDEALISFAANRDK